MTRSRRPLSRTRSRVRTSGTGTGTGTGTRWYPGGPRLEPRPKLLREADRALDVEFRLDTAPESLGGERLFQDGEGDLAGMACEPSEETFTRGIRAELIGVDALAVVVNMQNPVTGLRREDLRGIFSGEMTSWKEFGGPDLDIVPHVVGPDSATRRVFRRSVLDDSEYGEHRLVIPDADMNLRVEAEPGGIGFISYSFLCAGGEVRVLTIDGETCLPDNRRYPLVRPLYLLWRPGAPRTDDFIEWVRTPAARELIEKCFALPREIGWARWARRRGTEPQGSQLGLRPHPSAHGDRRR